MELSPERKQQIEEEEKQRAVEEQYRSQVRASLNATGALEPLPEHRKSHDGWLLGVIAIIAVALILVVTGNRTKTRASSDFTPAAVPVHAPSVRWHPITQKIASGQTVVSPGGYVQYRFEITPEMRNARLTGRFGTSGGTGNDIEAVIATGEEFANWINGHQARVLYWSQGRKTTDAFNIDVAPGTYYLAFNNRFSVFSAKNVSLDVDLIYLKMESY